MFQTKGQAEKLIQEQFDELSRRRISGDFEFFSGFVAAVEKLGLISTGEALVWIEKATKMRGSR